VFIVWLRFISEPLELIKLKMVIMTKKIIGTVFLIIASSLFIYIVYRITINPISYSKFKGFITGKAGSWSIVIIVFYSLILLPLFLMFKYGIKWTRLFKGRELSSN